MYVSKNNVVHYNVCIDAGDTMLQQNMYFRRGLLFVLVLRKRVYVSVYERWHDGPIFFGFPHSCCGPLFGVHTRKETMRCAAAWQSLLTAEKFLKSTSSRMQNKFWKHIGKSLVVESFCD